MTLPDIQRGALLRCVAGSDNSTVMTGSLYVLVRIKPNGNFVVRRPEGGANEIGAGGGWYPHRFELFREPNGVDYQPEGDYDLTNERRTS